MLRMTRQMESLRTDTVMRTDVGIAQLWERRAQASKRHLDDPERDGQRAIHRRIKDRGGSRTVCFFKLLSRPLRRGPVESLKMSRDENTGEMKVTEMGELHPPSSLPYLHTSRMYGRTRRGASQRNHERTQP